MVSPFPREHLPQAWKWCQQFAKEMLTDDSPQSLEQLDAAYHANAAGGGKSFCLMLGEKPMGMVWFDHFGDGVFAGHLVFDSNLPPLQKLNATKAALRAVFEAGARKVTWMVFADNRAFSMFLRRLGAELEGTLRRQARRQGVLVDVALFASFPEAA